MQIITWIIAGCWTIFILYWLVSAFGVKHDINGRSWWRSWWVRIIIIAALIEMAQSILSHGGFSNRLEFLGSIQSNTTLAAVGAVLTIAGIAIAVWARVHLGRNWSPAPALKEEHELVTSGPYHTIRHPIYTGIILAALGSALVTPWWLVMLVVITGIFVWRVRVEERLMLQEFPNQYPVYKMRTWALVPWVW